MLERADKNSDIKPLMKQLKQVPAAERQLDWVERAITAYARTRTKIARAASLLGSLRKERAKRGESKQHKQFVAALQARIAPYRLTNHGLSLPFSEQDPLKITSELQALFDCLDAHGYSAFINSGTLLGAVREQQFLPHDDDIDLAVLIEGATPCARRKALLHLASVIREANISDGPVALSRRGPLVKLEVEENVGVDLFAFWVEDDRVFIWPHTFGELNRDDVFPLTTASLHGTPFPAPKDAEKMLSINYGPDWHRPDSQFVFSWDNAKERFAADCKHYGGYRKRLSMLLKDLFNKTSRA